MFSLCHPWFTTTNLSYTFPILETSATALCGSTGNSINTRVQSQCLNVQRHPAKLNARTIKQEMSFIPDVIIFTGQPFTTYHLDIFDLTPDTFCAAKLLHQTEVTPRNFDITQVLRYTCLLPNIFTPRNVYSKYLLPHTTWESSKNRIQKNKCAKSCTMLLNEVERMTAVMKDSHPRLFHALLKWRPSRKTAPWTAEVVAVIRMHPAKTWAQQKLNPANVESSNSWTQ